MSNRSNLYKNPSFAYKRAYSLSSILQNLHAYNAVTGAGNATPSNDSPAPAVNPKRRRQRSTNPRQSQIEVDDDIDGPMSHQDYIHLRRKEAAASSSHGYQELTPDDILVIHSDDIKVEGEIAEVGRTTKRGSNSRGRGKRK